MSEVSQQLRQLFADHRLVFWYEVDADSKQELQEADLGDVTRVELAQNGFATKLRILIEEPMQKFLLYSTGPVPPKTENWLLDLQLSYPVFSTDRVSQLQRELKLDRTHAKTIELHQAFFGSKARREALSVHLPADKVSSPAELVLSMLAVLTRSTPRLEDILLSLLGADAGARDKYESQLSGFSLDVALWELAARQYGYQAERPGVEDFARALFITRLSEILPSEQPRMRRNSAALLLSRWKDSASSREAFAATAGKLADEFGIKEKLERADVQALRSADFLEEIDQYLLLYIARELNGGGLPPREATRLIEDRKRSIWYERYRHHYGALRSAADFLSLVESPLLLRSGAQAILREYTEGLYRVDVAYRKFQLHYRQANMPALNALYQRVEREYTNGFVLRLNDAWQLALDQLPGRLPTGLLPAQRDFWKDQVATYAERGNRVFVIISDGMRYETGAELAERLPKLGRYHAEIGAVQAAVPTFTQLGMAALLPHANLRLHPNGQVDADGTSTQGTANRDKILKKATDGRAVAITAEDFREKYSKRDAGRAWVKDYDVIYIYLNLIDKAGEHEEDQLASRTEDSFDEVHELLRIIARMNGNNVLITADHGYLFQASTVATSDFASYRVQGSDEKNNRRFVLGSDLGDNDDMMHFTADQLGLEGEVEVVFPKSVLRLRQRGSGSRYVHGGMSLQELIVPVVQVSIGRTADDEARPVDVELIGGTSRITTNQQSLRFYQKQAVSGKRTARTLKLGFYTLDNELISDEITEVFGSTDKEERNRERRLGFRFREMPEDNVKQIRLRAQDPAGAVYFERPFDFSVEIASDFDDFNY